MKWRFYEGDPEMGRPVITRRPDNLLLHAFSDKLNVVTHHFDVTIGDAARLRQRFRIEFAPGCAPVALAICFTSRGSSWFSINRMDAIRFDLLNQRRHLRRAGLAL